jgi:co-chaperonin GroES (HSP10)
MSTAKFKVGDKVRIVDTDNLGKSDVGLVGVIARETNIPYYDWLVKFDKEYDFTHNGDTEKADFRYRWYKSEWLELADEKPKHRFKVGDKVVALKNNGYSITTDGWEGVVTRVWFDSYETPMMTVKGKGFLEGGITFDVEQKGFEFEKSVQPWKIVIESSGDTTTAKYIGGKTVVKTATVTRYHTDEYSVQKAVEAVCTKLFTEEQTVEEPKYKVGDLVECISKVYSTYGKRGYLYKLDADGTWIVDFKVEYEDTHTAGRLPGKTGLWLVPDLDFKKVK